MCSLTQGSKGEDRRSTPRADDGEITARAIASMLRKVGATFPKESPSKLVRKNPVILKRLAKFLVQQCFRNTVIEDYHAGYGPGPGRSKTDRITDAEMKALMIEAVNKTHSFLWALFRDDIGPSLLADFGMVDPVAYWDEPVLDPKFAVGVVGMMRAFAGGAAYLAKTQKEGQGAKAGAKSARRGRRTTGAATKRDR